MIHAHTRRMRTIAAGVFIGAVFMFAAADVLAETIDVHVTALPNPTDVSDIDGEWILFENSSAIDLDMAGWTIEDTGGWEHEFSHTLSAGGSFRLCSEDDPLENGGLECDDEDGGMGLNNGAETLTLFGEHHEVVAVFEWGSTGEGEFKEFDFSVAPDTGTLTVRKFVVNDNSGADEPGDFFIAVYDAAGEIAASDYGSEEGHTYVLPVGAYRVRESATVGYTSSFSGDCGERGEISVAADGVHECVITNDDVSYASYCGDGEINQSWEQCDGGDSCTTQCQYDEGGECRDIVLARIVVDENAFSNEGDGDATSDIFVGSAAGVIPANAWFLLAKDDVYEEDPDPLEAGYADVPGLVVERVAGIVRTALYGGHEGDQDNREHVHGFVEFFNASPVVQRNAAAGKGLENAKDGEWSETPRDDEIWIEDSASHFAMTVASHGDGFSTHYEPAVGECLGRR